MFNYGNDTLPESIFKLFVPNTAIHIYHTINKHNLRPKQSNRVYICIYILVLLEFIF